MKTNTLVNFSKVVYTVTYWENQDGHKCKEQPTHATVHGIKIIEHDMAHYHQDYPFETCLERARRLNILDIWKFKCRFYVYSNHCIQYSGEKALKIWSDYMKWKCGRENKH